MSSDEEEFAPSTSNTANKKQKRLPRACDHCRKRKTKCDSSQMPGNCCSNCIAFGLECQHTMPVRKRGPQKRYVEDLEARINKMEELLRKLNPGMDVAKELLKDGSASPAAADSPESFHLFNASSPENIIDELEDERTQNELNDKLAKLDIHTLPLRFFGKSSSFMLMKSALNVKEEYVGKMNLQLFESNIRRDKFWRLERWERPLIADEQGKGPLTFPEPELLHRLVTAYLDEVQPIVNILHPPTFLRELQSGLHLRDRFFGSTVLAVCAVAARFANEPSTWLDGDPLSAGWMYFDQINLMRKQSLFEVSSLYEIQCYCICVMYLFGTTTPQGAWNLIGIALRFCEEVGVHRRNGAAKTPLTEQWKRVFWSLIILDRMTSAFLGRPSAMHHDDIDAEYPVECDDEYWDTEDPESRFVQPDGTVARTPIYFNTHLRVVDLHSIAFRNLYTTVKSRAQAGRYGPAWDQRIVAELDSELNNWMDNVPEYLRWEPTRTDRTLFLQSAMLYGAYYYIQIQIHRPFIHKDSPLAFPSLAICTNAARSTSRLLEAQLKKGWILRAPQMFIAAFSAGIVLLINVWGGRKRGLTLDQDREMHDVNNCLAFLAVCEKTHHIPGRFHDLLQDLVSIGEHCQPRAGEAEQPVDAPAPAPARKRAFDDLDAGWRPAASVHPGIFNPAAAPADSWGLGSTPSPPAGQVGMSGSAQAGMSGSGQAGPSGSGHAKMPSTGNPSAGMRGHPYSAPLDQAGFAKGGAAQASYGDAPYASAADASYAPGADRPYSAAMDASDLYMTGVSMGVGKDGLSGWGQGAMFDSGLGGSGSGGGLGAMGGGSRGPSLPSRGGPALPTHGHEGHPHARSHSLPGGHSQHGGHGLGGMDMSAFSVGGEPFPDLVLDDDMMAMWNSAPSAFDTHSWDVYLSAMSSQPTGL